MPFSFKNVGWWMGPAIGGGVLLPYTLNFTGLSAFPAGWTAPNWTVSANTAKNTPTQGGEAITNGAFTAWTADNPDNWNVGGEALPDKEISEVGSGEAHGGAGTGACNFFSNAANSPSIFQSPFTVNKWYAFASTISSVTAGSLQFRDETSSYTAPTFTTTGAKTWTGKVGNVRLTILPKSAADDITVDDVSAKLLSALIAYRNFSRNDVTILAPWTIAENTQAGVIALSDGTIDNCLLAVYDRVNGKADLLQYVAGALAVLASVSVAYVAGANVELRVSGNGTVAKLFYNNIQRGTDQTPNAAIRANTITGLFSTSVASTVPSLNVAAN